MSTEKAQTVTQLSSIFERWDKAKAFDAIVKECQDNPTKSRKWVLSLMKRNLKKAQETV